MKKEMNKAQRFNFIFDMYNAFSLVSIPSGIPF